MLYPLPSTWRVSPPYLPGRHSNSKVAASTPRRPRADRPSTARRSSLGTVQNVFMRFKCYLLGGPLFDPFLFRLGSPRGRQADSKRKPRRAQKPPRSCPKACRRRLQEPVQNQVKLKPKSDPILNPADPQKCGFRVGGVLFFSIST